jgi:hypothetical protein
LKQRPFGPQPEHNKLSCALRSLHARRAGSTKGPRARNKRQHPANHLGLSFLFSRDFLSTCTHADPPFTRRSTTHNREVASQSVDSYWPIRLPIHYPNTRDLPVNAGKPSGTLAEEKASLCRDVRAEFAPRPCLPCRRSRIRIPSAAFRKACICRSFSCVQSACASASRRTETGPAGNRHVRSTRRMRPFAGNLARRAVDPSRRRRRRS